MSAGASAGGLVGELLARCTFPLRDTPVTCAVSGGADSLALLVLAVAAGCRVTAVHVDHGLRPGSGAEADRVSRAAGQLGAAFRAERASVAPGPNLEERARTARYAVLPPEVLTGHTADDQAETLIINLVRGAGLDGMAGMAARRHPILALRRHETRALCGLVGLDPFEDPSNADPALLRNRIRSEVVPLLDEVARRDVTPVLVRQASLVREEAALLDELAAEIDPTDARALAAAPPPLARRAVRRWLAAGDTHPPGSAAVERALTVARGQSLATDLGRGRRLTRHGGRLTLRDG